MLPTLSRCEDPWDFAVHYTERWAVLGSGIALAVQ